MKETTPSPDLAAAPGGDLYVRCPQCEGGCVVDVGRGSFAEFAPCENCGGIGFVPASPAAETAPDAGLVEARRLLTDMWRSWTNGWSGNDVFDRYGKEIRAALARAGERT